MEKHKIRLFVILVIVLTIYSTIYKYKISFGVEMMANDISVDNLSVRKIVENEIDRLYQDEVKRGLEEHREREKGKDLFDGRSYRVETLIVTAYAPFDNQSGMCNDGNPNKTSTGSKPDWGTVAVNPKRFPYGTEFYIEGYEYKSVALDTGGAMRRNSDKIDLYMDTYKQAMDWGVREIEVIVFTD